MRSSFQVSDEVMSASLSRLFNGVIKVIRGQLSPFQALQWFFWEAARRKTPTGSLEITVDRLMSHGHMYMPLGYGIACFLLPAVSLFQFFRLYGYSDCARANGRVQAAREF